MHEESPWKPPAAAISRAAKPRREPAPEREVPHPVRKAVITACWFLIGGGVLVMVSSIYHSANAPASIAASLEQGESGLEGVEPEQLVAVARTVYCVLAVIGMCLIVLGGFGFRFPLVCLPAGLGLYLLVIVAPLLVNPSSIWRGILFNVALVIFVLRGFNMFRVWNSGEWSDHEEFD